jgi:Protein of unknown function (DUF732)
MIITRTLVNIAALVAIPAGALAAAGTANAAPTGISPVDRQFLTAIGHEGIGFSSPQGAIEDAHSVCQVLSNGSTGVQVLRQVVTQTNLTQHQATAFIADSVQAYCPDNQTQLTA